MRSRAPFSLKPALLLFTLLASAAGCHLLSKHKACTADDDCEGSTCDLVYGVCEPPSEGEGEG